MVVASILIVCYNKLMVIKAKKKNVSKTKKKFIEPDWDPWYCKMLDAVGEYMDTIGEKQDAEVTAHEIIVIKALVDFYGFDNSNLEEILDDLYTRAEILEKKSKTVSNH